MGGTVCPLGCRDSRNNLAEKINSCTDVIKRRPNGCKRKVLDTLPQKIRAIQIHNKYYISKTQRKNRCTASDICVEVSLLEEGGNKERTISSNYSNVSSFLDGLQEIKEI